MFGFVVLREVEGGRGKVVMVGSEGREEGRGRVEGKLG